MVTKNHYRMRKARQKCNATFAPEITGNDLNEK